MWECFVGDSDEENIREGVFSPGHDAFESNPSSKDFDFWNQDRNSCNKDEGSQLDDGQKLVVRRAVQEFMLDESEQNLEPVQDQDWRAKVADIFIHFLNRSEIRCMKEYRSLNQEASMWLNRILDYILSKEAMTALSQAPNYGPHRFNFKDYVEKTKRRNDVALKFTVSLGSKAIYKDYCLANNINRNFNPNTYMHRGEINERMYRHYLKRNSTRIGDNDKTDWEHQQVFLIKNGVTKPWFQYVIGVAGGKQLRRGFYDRLMQILNDDERMEELYAAKCKSMVRRMLGLDVEGEDDEENYEHLGKRLHVKGEHRARPKLPLHMAEFNRCLQLTRKTMENFASEYSL